MKKKKTFIQNRFVLFCLVLIFCIFLYSVIQQVQFFIFQVQMESNHYIGWEIDNSSITPSRLLALGGLMDAKYAGVLESIMGLLNQLSILIIVGFLCIFAFRNQKEIHPFTLRSYRYMKIGIMIVIFLPVIIIIANIVLLIITRPPLDWKTVIFGELFSIMKTLFEVVVYLCLLYVWRDGMQLQNASDETI